MNLEIMKDIKKEELIEEIKRVIGDNYWEEWMDEPIPALHDRIPKQIMETPSGRWELRRALVDIESGTF